MNCRGCDEGIVHNWHYDYPETYNEWKERTMGDPATVALIAVVAFAVLVTVWLIVGGK